MPTPTWQDLADLGVTYGPSADWRTVVQAALNSATANCILISGPVGIKRASAGAALSLSSVGKRLITVGGGYLFPIANAGLPPDRILDVLGARNRVSLEFRNKDDLGSTNIQGGPENPMDAMFLGGEENIAEQCRAFHFYTGFRYWYGQNGRLIDCVATVKDKSEMLGWANDGMIIEGCYGGALVRPVVTRSAGPLSLVPVFQNIAGASAGKSRCGIGADANNGDILIDTPRVGEGFVDQLHTEGQVSGEITIRSPQLYKGRRNAMTLAGGRVKVLGGWSNGIFGTSQGAVDELNGHIVIGSNSSVKDFTLAGDLPTQHAVRIMANSENVDINIRTEGTFAILVKGVANNVSFRGNHRGSCKMIFDIDQPWNPPRIYGGEVSGTFDGVVGVDGAVGRWGSGMVGKTRNLSIGLGEGYTAGDLFITDGNPVACAPELVAVWEGLDIKYLGTTSVTGTKALVRSNLVGGSAMQARIKDCSFPTSIFSNAAAGNWVSAPNWQITGNTSNTIGV